MWVLPNPTTTLIVRVFKFLLVIDELYQFRYLNEVEAIDKDDVNITHEETEIEDD
jgi:hypothetical protein